METAPPVYPTILPPSHIEPAPSYPVNLPPPVIPPGYEQYRDTPLPPTPFEHPTLLASIISGGSELVGRTFQAFLPEAKYLATIVPTRNKDELNAFCSHCWYLLQSCLERHIEHLLSELNELTSDPIVFARYLWRYRTTINQSSILEDYQAIIRSSRRPQVAKLVRAYTVFYDWNENSFTVSLA